MCVCVVSRELRLEKSPHQGFKNFTMRNKVLVLPCLLLLQCYLGMFSPLFYVFALVMSVVCGANVELI